MNYFFKATMLISPLPLKSYLRITDGPSPPFCANAPIPFPPRPCVAVLLCLTVFPQLRTPPTPPQTPVTPGPPTEGGWSRKTFSQEQAAVG